MLSEKVLAALAPEPSVTSTLTVAVPCAVGSGIPEITPVPESRMSAAGRGVRPGECCGGRGRRYSHRSRRQGSVPWCKDPRPYLQAACCLRQVATRRQCLKQHTSVIPAPGRYGHNSTSPTSG